MMKRLNWLWRLAMTGLCFVLFGAGGLLLSLVWFNLLLIVQHRRQFSSLLVYCQKDWRAGLPCR